MRTLLPLIALTAACTDNTIEATGSGYVEATAQGPDGIELPLAIWYPADTTESTELASYQFDLSGEAYAEAPPATGPFPIIINSHGNGGAKHAGATLFEQWAEAGYVVVSLDHVGNTFTDRPSAAEWIDIYIRRPEDVAAAYTHVVDLAAQEDGVLSGMVDAETLILAGHSTGGATVILASGGTMNRSTVLAACATNQISGTACDIADASEGATISLQPDVLPDPVATIALAPLDGSLFSDDLDMTGASLVVVGTRDRVTPSNSNATPLYESMPSPKAKVELQDANHYVFATVCQIPGLGAVLGDVAEDCVDPDFMTEETAIAATGAISIAFLDKYVAGNSEASVDSAASGFDVTIESE